MLVMCDHSEHKTLKDRAWQLTLKYSRLMGELSAMTRDRDAWKQAHEDLLEVRRQDLAAMQARIDSLTHNAAAQVRASLREARQLGAACSTSPGDSRGL